MRARHSDGTRPRSAYTASSAPPADIATTGGTIRTRWRMPEISATRSSASAEVIVAPLRT